MTRLTTRQAAKRLGVSHDTLAHYVEVGKVPSPEIIGLGTGKRVVHAWTKEEIEHVRKLLPKIANGRKTRWQRQRAAENKNTKTKAPARVPVPHKPKRPEKKKR